MDRDTLILSALFLGQTPWRSLRLFLICPGFIRELALLIAVVSGVIGVSTEAAREVDGQDQASGGEQVG
jgi:hypothetical protein